MPRQLVLYIACSLDGYIAGPAGDMSFLDAPMRAGEDFGYADFMRSVDTVLVGRKTYDWVMTQVPVFPHANKECYIITRTPRSPEGNLQFYSGDVPALVRGLKSRDGKAIFCDGGAELIHTLLAAELVDEMSLFILPVLLGGGTRLFCGSYPGSSWQLQQSKAYAKSGVMELRYARK